MAFVDLDEGILELFGEAQGSTSYETRRAAMAEFNGRRGFCVKLLDSVRYAARKQRGECPRCRKPVVGKNAHCKRCVAAISASTMRAYRQNAAAGRCVKCGLACTKRYCGDCFAKLKTYQEKYRAKGGCVNCGKPRDCEFQKCRECREKRAAAMRARRAKERDALRSS